MGTSINYHNGQGYYCTANVYGYFIGKSGCVDFKFMGIACYPQSLQKLAAKWKKERRFSVLFKSFFKFTNNFCGDFRLPVILVKFICMLRGTPCDTRISYTTFYSVVNPYRFKNILSVKKLFLTAKSLSVEFMERVIKFKVLFVLSIIR